MDILKKIGKAIAFPFKHNKAFVITACALLAFFITASIVITQVVLINNTFNTLFGEERRVLKSGDPSTAQYYKMSDGITDKKSALANANAVNEKICEEGFVLLKNEGALPLKAGAKVSVYGMNSVDMVYGGSGSAAKDSADSVDLYKSLTNAGISYNTALKSFYDGKKSSGKGRPKSPSMGDIVNGFATGELAQSEYSGGANAYAGEFTDAALVVISRIGGEGYDLPTTSVNTAGRSNAQEHYLELDDNEKALLSELCKNGSPFKNVVLIINCATSMELGFMNAPEYNGKINGALWIGTTGGTGMNALGKILNGSVNPSGRLVDTYAADFTVIPAYYNFGTNSGNGGAGNRYNVNGTAQDAYFVDYEEGIYVGYRYFETRGYGDADWYNSNVVFPFGYGKSYTDFEWSLGKVTLDGIEISDGHAFTADDLDKTVEVEVTVKNVGAYDGKDVVQLYFSAPYFEGSVEKSHVVLGAFAKTNIIGKQTPTKTEKDKVTLEFKVRDMASYDYTDGGCYVLDEGDYSLYIGKNAHSWAEDGLKFTLNNQSKITFDSDSATGNKVENRFADVSSHIERYLSRSDWENTFPTAPTEDDLNVEQGLIDSMSMEAYVGKGTQTDIGKPWYSARSPRQKRKQQTYKTTEVKLYRLIGKDYNDPLWDKLLNQLTYSEMAYLIGTGNFNTAAMKNIDKPKTTDPDGPAGFTNFMTVIKSTAVVYDTCFYASECVIGATYNVELAERMGEAAGNESLAGNERGDGRTYSGWYAPAVNIHRTPFGGRDWEYYSEDGLLAGKMAAGVVRGAKSKGVYTYIKHFALNEQETHRDTTGLITWANEQAMREIYLKPFELTVKEGGTNAMMSSFNRIGTVWAGGSYELLTQILRNEWGFKGMVITDYSTSTYMYTDQMIRAGGDLVLMQDKQPSLSGTVMTSSHKTALRQATKNILYTVANSNAMNGMGEGIIYAYAMPYWKIMLICLDCAVVAALGVWGFFSIRKSLKNEKLKSEENTQSDNIA